MLIMLLTIHTILYLLTYLHNVTGKHTAKNKFANKRRSYPEPKPKACPRCGKHFELGFVTVRFLCE